MLHDTESIENSKAVFYAVISTLVTKAQLLREI